MDIHARMVDHCFGVKFQQVIYEWSIVSRHQKLGKLAFIQETDNKKKIPRLSKGEAEGTAFREMMKNVLVLTSNNPACVSRVVLVTKTSLFSIAKIQSLQVHGKKTRGVRLAKKENNERQKQPACCPWS